MNLQSHSLFLCVLLVNAFAFSHANANEQTKNEVRQALLSIQAELNQMEGRKAKKPPAQEASFVPEPAPELLTPTPPNPAPELEAELPPEPQVEQAPVPAFLLGKEEVERELQSVQDGLDQLNRDSSRFPAGQVLPSTKPLNITLPEPPVEPEPKPTSFLSEQDRVALELRSIQAALDEMNLNTGKLSTPLPPQPVSPPTPAPAPVAPREAPAVTPSGGPGIYLVPSIALVYSSGFDWTSMAGKAYEIDEELGYAAGLRTGWMGENFFTDFQLTYARSNLESNAFSAIPMRFSGETEFFGFHLTGGGKVDLADRVKLPFGIGVGGGRQEISMDLGGVPYSEHDFVLTYHLFAGLEYQATDHLLLGLRYRLVNLGELPSFSSRNLQLFEVSCGYQY